MGIKLISLVVCCVLFGVFCCATSKSTVPQRDNDNLLHKALQFTERLTEASTRGTTSSQVIEYNPRNIALMTLLNSVLIVGGLLGTMSRNDKALPFKRVDAFSKLKKRFMPNRRSSVQAQPLPMSPVPSLFHPLPIVPHQNSRPLGMHPSEHLVSNYFTKPNHLNLPVEFEINPRIPVQIVRRTDDLVNDSRSSTHAECDHVLQCFDALARPHNPSLSELSKSALRLLNDATGSKIYSSLMAKVRDLIEIEQKGHCFVQYTCPQNLPIIDRSFSRQSSP